MKKPRKYWHASYPDPQANDGAIVAFNNEHMARLFHHTTNANLLITVAIYSPSLCTAPCPYFIAVYFRRCVMAITMLEMGSTKPSNFNTDVHPQARKDATNDGRAAVQYRQLISRAVTQRLHSPSLDDLTKTNLGDAPVHSLEEWELQERCIARNKARTEAEELCIPWSKTARLLACDGPAHIECYTHTQGLTAISAIYPRCQKRRSASPCPHAHSVRSTAEEYEEEPRGD